MRKRITKKQKPKFRHFFIDEKVKLGSGNKNQTVAAKNKGQEGFVLQYKVKRRIPLETIDEIRMRFDD